LRAKNKKGEWISPILPFIDCSSICHRNVPIFFEITLKFDAPSTREKFTGAKRAGVEKLSHKRQALEVMAAENIRASQYAVMHRARAS